MVRGPRCRIDLPSSADQWAPAKPTPVLDTFWRFTAERQAIFFRRLDGTAPPYTEDPILQRYRFTNAYRASDRVSQYLIRRVIYRKYRADEEVFFRTLLFKIFNRISTWELLEQQLGEVTSGSYAFGQYDEVLENAIARGQPIFSAAYIMPSGRSAFGYRRKHRNYLRLLETMMQQDVPEQVAEATSMQEVFELLRGFPLIGDFLAYQYATDLNYSELTNFSEMHFVVPGPGALDGIHKCFSDLGGLTPVEIIRLVADRQDEEFARLGLRFQSLWGRRLKLIDCQNLFCEVGKYARLAHPEVRGTTDRTRIKQVFRAEKRPIDYWYPPKWGVNESVREHMRDTK
jgi:hypothetical protein